MGLRDLVAFALSPFHGGDDGTVGPAPADDEQLAIRRSAYRQLRDLIGDVGDLLGARLDHVLVVLRVVADVSCDVLFLQPADAVLETGRAGNGPGTDQPVV